MTNTTAKIDQLVSIFNQLFKDKTKTTLQMGADEPFYKAPSGCSEATIFAREDYFSSALHEISHWCVAGEQRRTMDDFGYWYEPEGRSAEQQAEFEKVEVKPQAIEWLLSLACDHPFHFSADNLSQGIDASESFKQAVTKQARLYQQTGLPDRAQSLFNKLCDCFLDGKLVEELDV
jgi:elongation factor P hydroxylase